jgi:hypothetical protein
MPARSVALHASASYFPPRVCSYVTADGSRIQGSFENGLAHGRGSRRYQNNDEYAPCPQLLHHLISRHFFCFTFRARMYTGEFEGGFRHGTGIMMSAAAATRWLPPASRSTPRYRSQAKFTGQFVLDMFSGQGELLYADGSR